MRHIQEALQTFYEADHGFMLPKKRRSRAYNSLLNFIWILGSSEGNGTGLLNISLEEYRAIMKKLRPYRDLSASNLITGIASCTSHTRTDVRNFLSSHDFKRYLVQEITRVKA